MDKEGRPCRIKLRSFLRSRRKWAVPWLCLLFFEFVCTFFSSTSPVTSAELLYRTMLWNLENISYEIYSYTWQQRKDWMKLGVLKSMEFYFHRMKSSIDGQIQQLWMHLLLLLKILLPIFNSLVENFMHVHNVFFFFTTPYVFSFNFSQAPTITCLRW